MIMVIFMKFVRKLPDVNELKKDYALSSEQNKRRKDCISEINTILANRINRKIKTILNEKDDEIIVRIEGPDEDKAAEKLEELFGL